tara:strand:- start:243 stop:650 length:408 start_codon:yes stop_codon:yes gene_type:complete
MATIKINLSINSSDVLPFVVAIDESKEISTASDANANASNMGQLTVSTTALTINTEIDGGVDNRALVYIKNTGVVATAGAAADPNIIVDDETSPIMEIAPGEFCFLPYNGGANSTLTVETASGTGYCDYLVIELT